MDILKIAEKFSIEGRPVSAMPISGGHINDTFRITTTSSVKYIFQRINRRVLKDPPMLMENVAAVTSHLRGKGVETLTIVPTLENEMYCLHEGEYYRMYTFVGNAVSMLSPASAEDFRSAGEAFGAFIEALSDMPADKVHIIPKASHNTQFHLDCFKKAVKEDSVGRADGVRQEIELVLARARYAEAIQPLLSSGEIPLRIVHNDTKFSNIMIDTDTHKARCILDLDNVMPGSLLTDYGDSIRSGCDLGGTFSEELMLAYRDGFLSSALSVTDREKELMSVAPAVVTYENAMRYLTDYLSGDVYFKVERPGQNLETFRRRWKLLDSIEQYYGL